MGNLQAYVCRGCGYTELYTANARALPVDKIPGAKLLNGQEGPVSHLPPASLPRHAALRSSAALRRRHVHCLLRLPLEQLGCHMRSRFFPGNLNRMCLTR